MEQQEDVHRSLDQDNMEDKVSECTFIIFTFTYSQSQVKKGSYGNNSKLRSVTVGLWRWRDDSEWRSAMVWEWW